MGELGKIVVLNGAPRSGKTSIVRALQDAAPEPWMNLGVDVFARGVTPEKYQPGIGLRPGGENPDLETWMPVLYAALYDSVAAHSRLGLNVIVDVGHHDYYSKPLGILPDCAKRMSGLPAILVGVRCPIEVIMKRRDTSKEGPYVTGTEEDPAPAPVIRWQREVHIPGIYDLEVYTSVLSPEECAQKIRDCLAEGIPSPSAFERIAQGEQDVPLREQAPKDLSQ